MNRNPPAADVRALLFDLGGVLLDVDFGRVLGTWAAAARCDPAQLLARFSFDEAYCRHERGEISAGEYFDSLRSSLDLRLSDQEFLDGWNSLYAGVIELIPALLTAAALHFPLYAFTNSNAAHQAVWSTRFAGDLACFRTIFASSSLGLRKPDTSSFVAVCEKIGLRPDQVMFFDDTPENAIGAEMAGLKTVLVHSAADIRTALTHLGVNTASENIQAC